MRKDVDMGGIMGRETSEQAMQMLRVRVLARLSYHTGPVITTLHKESTDLLMYPAFNGTPQSVYMYNFIVDKRCIMVALKQRFMFINQFYENIPLINNNHFTRVTTRHIFE